MLYSLSGNSNILAYHDHKIIEHKDKLGWDILIRMDFVKPLSQYMAENRLTRLEIVNLGIDLCSALDICARHGIVHRDIKEENIFIDNDGIYKLGDFGIAMRLAKRSKILFKMGTPNYMAPEVYHNEDYNAAVDLYSLGIVLYKMLNHGRLPHIPAYPIKSQPQDSQAAFEKRMSGETYAKPDQAGLGLAKIIMKACAYRAVDRYETPLKMKQALEKTLVRLSDAERGEWVTELVVHPPKARLQSRRLTTIRQDHPHSDRKTR
jgi:serine/threonine protein kinase